MTCPKCKKEIPQKSMFCPNCGCQISTASTKEHTYHKSVNKKLLFTLIGCVSGIIIIVISVYFYSLPSTKYDIAERAYASEKYDKAVKYYTAAGEYGDAVKKLNNAKIANHYSNGVTMMEKSNYEEAKKELKQAGIFKDAKDLIIQCDYSIALTYMDSKEYVNAAKSFKSTNGYKDSDAKIIEMGKTLVNSKNYKDAITVFDCSKTGSGDAYAHYAKGKIKSETKDFFNAAKSFSKAGDILDAKDLYNETQYNYASGQLKSTKYADALKAFDKILDYKDSADLITACKLMTASDNIKSGKLNTAKEALEKLPPDYSYNNVSVASLTDILNANSQWLAICGKWTSSGGEMRTTQNGSYGYTNYWYKDFKKDELDMVIQCIPNNDGTVTVVTNGEYPVYTSFSTVSIGIEVAVNSLSSKQNMNSYGTIQVDDYTTITLSETGITVNYKKNVNNQDIYFRYVYETNISYGQRKDIY